MDRLSHLRGEAGGSRDSTLDTTSPPSFMTANESSSKYFSLSEVESTFDISSIKDVSLASTNTDAEGTITNSDGDKLDIRSISNLSPIGKKSDILGSYKIGKQIEAANILSGGVDIFDDNENSYDGDELVIDDNVDIDDKSNSELKDSENIEYKSEENIEPTLIHEQVDIASKDTEVVLQIDGKNVDAIDIGNGLYLYRKEAEELAAVQIIDDDQQQTSFKFLKVRENLEGNLEVYEEIEIEVPKEVPAREKTADKKISSHVPIKDINKVISESACNKVSERMIKTPKKETITTATEVVAEVNKEISPDSKSEVNFNGKMMKFSESRKSPVIGSFTPMTFHSTPNKEGIPLTKTMVDQQLHPNRHSDNIKKTIEVHTDSCKLRPNDTPTKNKDADDNKINYDTSNAKEIVSDESIEKVVIAEEVDKETMNVKKCDSEDKELSKCNEKVFNAKSASKNMSVNLGQGNVIDVTEKKLNKALFNDNIAIEKKKDQANPNMHKENIKDRVDADDEILQAVGENVDVEKVEEIASKDTETYSRADIEINDDEDKATKPMQPTVDTDNTLQNEEPAIKEDSRVNNQDKTKSINDATIQYKKNVDENIVIEDSNTVVEDKSVESITTNENVTDKEKCILLIDKTSTKPENGDFETKQIENDESVTTLKIENHQKKVENYQISNKVDSKCDIIPADSSSSTTVEIQKQENKDDNTQITPIPAKNILSKIPLPDNNSMTKPIISKLETSEATKQTEIKPEKEDLAIKASEHKTTPKELIKNELEKIPLKIVAIHDSSQKQTKKALKPEPISEHVNEKAIILAPIQVIAKAETPAQKKQSHVIEKSLKKEPEISESQRKVAHLVNKDSTSKLKIETSKVKIISDIVINSVDEKPVVGDKCQVASECKTQIVIPLAQKQKLKGSYKETNTEKVKVLEDVKISKDPIIDLAQPSTSSAMYDVNSTSVEGMSQNTESKSETEVKGEPSTSTSDDTNPNNTKKAAVPFGKWTATNRKEFLDKIKTRAPAAATTSNQLKNSNDLNRRDVLQKIDSQRQTSNALSKSQEANKPVKNETAFSKTNIVNKDDIIQENKTPLNAEAVVTEVFPKADSNKASKAESNKEPIKQDFTTAASNEPAQVISATSTTKKEAAERTEVNYQDLIDKTIEGMIHRTPAPPKVTQDEANQNSTKDANIAQGPKHPPKYQPTDQATLDAIEMKMNELHGIPFIERPPHELPQLPTTELKTYSKTEKEKQSASVKTTKIPNLLPFPNKNQQIVTKDSIIDLDSEDEIIEHEPITGDIGINKKNAITKPLPKEKILHYTSTDKSSTDANKKESIITEKDFDKFARRTSISYENCLTVNFDGKEPHNVIQTVVETDLCPKTYSRKDIERVDPKAKLPFKYQNVHLNTEPVKVQPLTKFGQATEDSSNRNQSKLQKAYQSALTAKRQLECPITIIEDKPVKVVFMDHMEFVPTQLNVQGQDLSPIKKIAPEPDNITVSTCDSLDSDVLDAIDDPKSQEEVKTKTKHQRKQVLTPVDEPELELIVPKDLGLEVSPKKKRKTDEDKNVKYPMRKKYYLLGSNALTEEKNKPVADVIKNPLKETVNRNNNGVSHNNAVSAIDSLVKAAELLEHQSENMNITGSPNPDSHSSTPVKRGRGRPRKYPLPEGGLDKTKVPSPQKKLRLIDAQKPKRDTTTDDDEDDDSDDQIIKENWTMGKINENIVCPICNKLFRTENVVFKHVKHCTGPSPSRSDSDKRSPRRMRQSQESDLKSRESKSDDMDFDDDKPLVVRKETPKKRKSKDSISKTDAIDDIIVIEDTPPPPVKEKAEKKEKEVDERKIHESRKPKAKVLNKNNDLVCEFCGKIFRQLSYLVSHKLQHKKEEPKKIEKDIPVPNKSVYSCEVCKKEFRKLHHLVQHRIIHNPSSIPTRSLRKSSSEQQSEHKIEKEPSTSKQTEDQSAGFRCEPCDKSFRKLHHLVEHRETHDGINRQKTTTVTLTNAEKPVSLHQCEVCKKTFRKLHHLIEHKEVHVETCSEKSDDKSVKSSLSTRDIIHECSLCYMVFPNEHSLNKHTIICRRKKSQSKQVKPNDETETIETVDEASEGSKTEDKVEDVDSIKPIVEKLQVDEKKEIVIEKADLLKDEAEASKDNPKETAKEAEPVKESIPQKIENKPIESHTASAKTEDLETENHKMDTKSTLPQKIKKVEVKEPTKIQETPKKRTFLKDKSAASASKRLKTSAPQPTADVKPPVESSDDDEVRYMLNPNYKVEEPAEEKVFMKVRAKKRSSLQIERPNSKDLVKRRTSLQHPPKIPRLKPKPVEVNIAAVKTVAKTPKVESVPSTDSDDSETVKYSFPKTIPEKLTKAQEQSPKDVQRNIQKKSLVDKRKSLSGIAKRKSLGKAAIARHKPSPAKPIKRRTLEVEHRCDCGQLFSSAALLSRHTTLAHTPPRIRRRRSPPPDDKPLVKPAPRKSTVAEKPKQAPASRKSSARSDSSTSTNIKPNKSETKATRKSVDMETKTPADARKLKPEKSEAKSSVKLRRPVAHRGVPVPEKMRKLLQKNNK